MMPSIDPRPAPATKAPTTRAGSRARHRPRPPRLTFFAIFSALTVGPLGACDDGGESGDDEAGETGSANPDLPALIDIEVEVSYAGEIAGALGVGAFAQCPVAGAPSAFRRITDPVFPGVVELINLDPGDYCVYAFIDLPPENPNFPGPEDPSGEIAAIRIDASLEGPIALEIVDP